MKTAAVSEGLSAEADTSGVADRAQGVREVLPALMPVKPAYPEGAGPSSGNFKVRYHTGAGLGSAE